ncbi:MAG: preprotein translocase subunit SecG [Veillonella sp.]|nr:preprotein translocase subunit SecG [Veillonella sp.]
MTNFLMIVEVIVSILLIVVVVAQNSKNAGMGGAVSGAADSSFGGKQRGLDAFLSKCTIILGIIFSILMMKACFAGFFFFHPNKGVQI